MHVWIPATHLKVQNNNHCKPRAGVTWVAERKTTHKRRGGGDRRDAQRARRMNQNIQQWDVGDGETSSMSLIPGM